MFAVLVESCVPWPCPRSLPAMGFIICGRLYCLRRSPAASFLRLT